MSLNPAFESWRSRSVWVVGASSGIGAALAKALLQEGALVALSARRSAPLKSLAAPYGANALALPLNVSDEASWQRAYQQLCQWQRRLDHLIFCAADYQPMRAWSLNADRAAQMIDTNFKGAVYGVDTVLPDMLHRHQGGIALVASVAGYVGLPKSLIYGPTKAALINFAESLYIDLHARGIGVSVINPGFVDTPMTQSNDFHMPGLITPEKAAQAMMTGLRKGQFEVHFPRRFTAWMKLLRHLPYALQFRLLKNLAGPK